MTKRKTQTLKLELVQTKFFEQWLKKQTTTTKSWLTASNIIAKTGSWCLLPGSDGGLKSVVAIIDDEPNLWSIAHLPAKLPAHRYALDMSFAKADATALVLGWKLARYEFTKYKKSTKKR